MMAPNRRILRFMLALVVVAYGLTAVQGVLERLGAAARPGTPGGSPAEQLADLPVAEEANADSYVRERFGAGWATGSEGCDTRFQVLLDEAVAPATVDGCEVLTGRWVSLYDGVETTDPNSLDLDHLVPLAEAWASGADRWSDQRRVAFANDLDSTRPDALIAVTAGANRAKGDSDPAEWLPADPAMRCRYADAWITQKAAWNLSIDEAERHALTQALATCPTRS